MEGKAVSAPRIFVKKRCIVEYLKILIWKVLAYRPRFQHRTDLVSARERGERGTFRFSPSIEDGKYERGSLL